MGKTIAWFAKHRVAANLLMVLIIGGGAISLFGGSIIQEVFPEFSLDIITISVEYLGAAPGEVEEGVCVKIEEAIRPTSLPRSDSQRKIIPTVAEISAYPRIGPMCPIAMRNPSPTVGSPPRNRIIAAPMRAELAKMMTVYCTT